MLAQQAAEYGKEIGADVLLFSSRTHDSKKNPLPYEKKIAYIRKAFNKYLTVPVTECSNIIEIAKSLSNKYTCIVVYCGEDRASSFDELLNKYNHIEYNFDKIEVRLAGNRKETGTHMEQISATKMRQALIDEDFDYFVNNLPEELIEDCEDLAEDMLENLTYDEDVEYLANLSEDLSIAQRRRKAVKLKRIKGKLKIARAKSMKRRANTKVLQGRSRRKAIRDLKKKFTKGRTKLSAGEKNRIERMVKKRKPLVDRLARKGLVAARDRDKTRLRKNSTDLLNVVSRGAKIINESQTFEEFKKGLGDGIQTK